jgi:hypothetical protein
MLAKIVQYITSDLNRAHLSDNIYILRGTEQHISVFRNSLFHLIGDESKVKKIDFDEIVSYKLISDYMANFDGVVLTWDYFIEAGWYMPLFLKELHSGDPVINNNGIQFIPRNLTVLFGEPTENSYFISKCRNNLGLNRRVKIIDIYDQVRLNSEYFHHIFSEDYEFLDCFNFNLV